MCVCGCKIDFGYVHMCMWVHRIDFGYVRMYTCVCRIDFRYVPNYEKLLTVKRSFLKEYLEGVGWNVCVSYNNKEPERYQKRRQQMKEKELLRVDTIKHNTNGGSTGHKDRKPLFH